MKATEKLPTALEASAGFAVANSSNSLNIAIEVSKTWDSKKNGSIMVSGCSRVCAFRFPSASFAYPLFNLGLTSLIIIQRVGKGQLQLQKGFGPR